MAVISLLTADAFVPLRFVCGDTAPAKEIWFKRVHARQRIQAATSA